MDVDAARLLARKIDEAHCSGRLLRLNDRDDLWSMNDAYRVQDELTALRRLRGDRRIGWKLGYTSDVMRRQMNVDAPNFGPLLTSMKLKSGGIVSSGLKQPRVEPEILIELSRDISPTAAAGELTASVACFRMAMEVVDSVWRDYRFTLAANTADGSSAAQVVLGAELPSDTDLAAMEVELRLNDQGMHTGRGAEAMGHPLMALTWLVRSLGARGKHLRAGEIVLTGGLTAAVPLQPGDRVSAHFRGFGEVTVARGPIPAISRLP